MSRLGDVVGGVFVVVGVAGIAALSRHLWIGPGGGTAILCGLWLAGGWVGDRVRGRR